MLFATTGQHDDKVSPILNGAELMAAQRLIRRIPIGEKIVDAILDLVRSARPDETAKEDIRRQVAWGPSPRASQALMLAVRARALLDGRMAPSLDDVVALAPPVLRHRMALTFAARADGAVIDDVIGRILQPFR
jgi:MoxR-like ATPase